MGQLGKKNTMATATGVHFAAVLFGALTKQIYVHRLDVCTVRVPGLTR